nr:helix-turn-helix transcriptional regulator [Streptomyces scabichelini]
MKERSGLSYGVLGKRLHMSASTLHRYVNGDAVPTDYAPVERFARLCKATPEELVELHRRWVQADALRGKKGVPAPESGSSAPEPDRSVPEPDSSAPEPEAVPSPARRRRTVLLAGAAVVAAVVSAALVVNLVPGDDDNGQGKEREGAVGAVSSTVAESAGGTPSADGKRKLPSPSASRTADEDPTASASRTTGAGGGQGAGTGTGTEDGATAPTVDVNPYKWEGPCSQHYLVNRDPEQVPPPPTEPDARGWVGALGGVAAGEQLLELTVQGTGKATVVLKSLHVRVTERSAPLAWNDYTMGVGCGGSVETASFGVDLDAGRPATKPRAGKRDFPYSVSESDPEVFYVFADVQAHNVSWYLELDWSSGTKSGTVRISDNGKPFRTSGRAGRPSYQQPIGASAWETAPPPE